MLGARQKLLIGQICTGLDNAVLLNNHTVKHFTVLKPNIFFLKDFRLIVITTGFTDLILAYFVGIFCLWRNELKINLSYNGCRK